MQRNRSLLAAVLVCPLAIAGCPLQPTSIATRADLAAAYLDLEIALRDHPAPAANIVAINRQFDQASISFFSGQFGRAIQQIDGLRESVLAPEGWSGARRVLESLKVRVDPPTFVTGSRDRVTAQMESLYSVELKESGPIELCISFSAGAGAAPISASTTLDIGKTAEVEQTVEIPVDGSAIRTGTYAITLSAPGVEPVQVGRWFVTDTSFDAIRDANEARIRALKGDSATLAQAIGIVTSRNDLLADEPSETNSAQFLADMPALARDIAAEIDTIAAGRSPYTKRVGDHWRTLGTGRGAIRMRVFAPPAIATDDTPRPLIVAFHGAGGDENMFFDGYGAGLIKTLAESRGAIVASPETTPFTRDRTAFARLVDSLALDYPIDRARVYAIGHSMGGAVIAQLATQPDLVAGVCGISSAGVPANSARLAPTLLIAAENDLINRGSRAQTAATRAAENGAPVEYRLVKDYGHTLVVGHVLPDVFDWLLRKSNGQASSKPAGR